MNGIPNPIRAKHLRGACTEQRELFEATFPEGMPITVENIERAFRVGLAVEWAVERRFPAPLWEEYERQRAPLWEEYKRQRAPLLAKYERQRAPFWEEYERKEAPLLAEYRRQLVPVIVRLAFTDDGNDG